MKERYVHKIGNSGNDLYNGLIQNMYIPSNPILPEPRNGVIGTLENSFKEVEKINEQIKSTDDDVLKSSLRQQKNAICKRMVEYSGDSINKSQIHQDQEEYRAYKRKFWDEQEQDMDLMEKHYGEFRSANYSNNKMLLETKSTYEDLEEAINKTLADKNVDQEYIDKTWQSVGTNYEKYLEKCKFHETFVKQMQYKVLDHGCLFGGTDKPKSFIDAKNIAEQLNVKHKQAIDNLKFNSDQVVKQFIAKGFEISGQSPEESSIILEIKDTYETLEETINKSLADKNIEEEVKNQVWQLPFYSSKYKQVLDKLKTHEKLVRMYEDQILNCDTSLKANSLNMELKKIHKDVTEELNFHTNQVIKHFVTKTLQITGKPLEETSMMLDIKGILDGFREKINKNFEDNLINEKIKSDVGKLFRSKCDQHLDKLKLIEKSVQKCEHELLMCDNFKQSQAITNSLDEKQQQIDSWKFESNNLIEEIINKATEFSYQTDQVQSVLNEPELIQPVVNIVPNQQNNLSIEELLKQLAELKQTVIEQNEKIFKKDETIIEQYDQLIVKDQKLELANSTNQNLVIKNNETNSKYIILKSKYDLSQVEISGLKNQVNDLKEDKIEVKNELKEVKKDNVKLKEKLDLKDLKIDNLVDKSDELNEKLLVETNKYHDIKNKYDLLYNQHNVSNNSPFELLEMELSGNNEILENN